MESNDDIIKVARDWARNRAKEVSDKFLDPHSIDVTFTDFIGYEVGKIYDEVVPGMSLEMLEQNDRYYVLKCLMDCTLSTHYHSTHSEIFVCVAGKMNDNINSSLEITKGQTLVYNAGVKHEPTGQAELIIIGIKG